MKTKLQRGMYLIMTLFCATMFAQVTGVTNSSTQTNLGILNKTASNGNNLTTVLICGAPGNALWIDDVESKLDNTGLVDADTFLINTGTPTLAELQAYDSVFVFTDGGALDGTTFGNNLNTYIENGGKVVDAAFGNQVGAPVGGNFAPYFLYQATNILTGTQTLGTVNNPAHPIMENVNSFNGGSSSYRLIGGTIPVGASTIAEWSDGTPLIIAHPNMGPANTRRAFINFYPPSDDVRDDFWDVSTDGAIIIANALNWAAGVSGDLPTVLVAGAPGNPVWLDDVETQLESTGNFSEVDTFLTSTATPTLAELQSYDAVYIFTDADASDPAGFGNVLEQYIDGGGAVLDATFSPNVPISGGFTQYQLYSNSGQSFGTNLGLGTINVPNHPTLEGVSTFDGGTASFHNTSGTLAVGATVIAEYSTGAPLIIVAENVGPANVRRAFLNFYPPSIDARDDFWDTASDGATLMASTIYWLLDQTPNSAPQAQCQAFTAQLDASGSVTITASDIDNGSSDTDGTITLSLDITTFTCADLGANTVELTVTDDDGATATCTATVTVVDEIDPTINCPADATVTYLEGESFEVPDYVAAGDVTGMDNCSFTITQTPAAGQTFTSGTFTISFEITDESGNTNTCDFELTVDEVLSVNDIALADVSLYPNPATSQITIEGSFEIAKAEVFNLLGQKMLTSTSEILNIQELPNAIYLLNITDSEGNKTTKRFIKK